jgi:hypothetical protein
LGRSATEKIITRNVTASLNSRHYIEAFQTFESLSSHWEVPLHRGPQMYQYYIKSINTPIFFDLLQIVLVEFYKIQAPVKYR